MLYPDAGTQFLSDQIEHYVIAASSQLPCPSCLTGLMQPIADGEYGQFPYTNQNELDGRYDGFKCHGCERRVLIERMPS